MTIVTDSGVTRTCAEDGTRMIQLNINKIEEAQVLLLKIKLVKHTNTHTYLSFKYKNEEKIDIETRRDIYSKYSLFIRANFDKIKNSIRDYVFSL